MNIVQRLKEYKKNKAIVDSTQARIDNYKRFLQNEDVELYTYVNIPDNLGMPKAPHSQKSPTESAIMTKELDRETVQQWINDDESRIFLKKMEVEQINKALEGLTEEQQFVVEKKYIHEWMWRAIEIEYNKRFKNQNDYISERGLQFKAKEGLAIMNEILEPFYKQFNIA